MLIAIVVSVTRIQEANEPSGTIVYPSAEGQTVVAESPQVCDQPMQVSRSVCLWGRGGLFVCLYVFCPCLKSHTLSRSDPGPQQDSGDSYRLMT